MRTKFKIGRRSGRVSITTPIVNTLEDQPSQSKTKGCWRLSLSEFIFATVLVFTQIGCSLSLDTPGALQNFIIKNYHLSTYEFSLFYSLYFIPTIILNGFGGFLIDRVMGIKLTTLIYSAIGVFGVALFAVGGIVNLFWLMLMGRLIFGMGNEMATGVCTTYCVFAWYRNRIMNLLACLFSVGNILGTLLLYQIGPRLISYFQTFMSEKQSLNAVMVIASVVFVVTTGFAILLTHLKPKEVIEVMSPDVSLAGSSPKPEEEERKASFKDILAFPLIFWLLCLQSYIRNSMGSYYQFSQGLLTSDEFQLSVVEASNVVTAMGLVKMLLSLPVSISVDLLGRNTWYILLAQALWTMTFWLFSLKTNPYVCMILIGLSDSLYDSTILPLFAYPVEKHLTGTCYGLVSVFSGMSTVSAPLIIGKIIDQKGYIMALNVLSVVATVGLLNIIVVIILDKRSTGILSMTPKQRVEFELRIKKEKMLSKQQDASLNFTSISCLNSNESLKL